VRDEGISGAQRRILAEFVPSDFFTRLSCTTTTVQTSEITYCLLHCFDCSEVPRYRIRTFLLHKRVMGWPPYTKANDDVGTLSVVISTQKATSTTTKALLKLQALLFKSSVTSRHAAPPCFIIVGAGDIPICPEYRGRADCAWLAGSWMYIVLGCGILLTNDEVGTSRTIRFAVATSDASVVCC